MDFGAIHSPFTVVDLLESAFQLLNLFGGYILLGLVILLLPQLIGLLKKSVKDEPKKKGRRTSKQTNKKSKTTSKTEKKSERASSKPKRTRNKYKSASLDEIYNYQSQRKRYMDLAKSTMDTRQRIFYEGKALEIRSKVIRRHGIVLG